MSVATTDCRAARRWVAPPLAAPARRLRPSGRSCLPLHRPQHYRTASAGAAPQAPRSRKEVFQPHLPVRLPCYDLAPVTRLTLGRSSRSRTSGTPSSHGLTGGVSKARERIHRAMADARLLANPASRSRVADSDPNWVGFFGSARRRRLASFCAPPL